MSLRTRLALAFALVAAVVAGLVGVLSHRAASERITDETDRSLSSATTALLEGQTAVLSALPPSAPTDRDGLDGNGPGRPDPRGEGPAFVAHQIAPDGTVTFLGGRPVRLPVDPATRALAAYGRTGQVATQEIELGRGAYRVRTTALGDGHGAVQVGLDIDQSRRVLGGLATEIAIISAVVTVVAAGAGWLLARRITRRLVRLASTAEDIADHGRIEVDVPVEGRDEVGRLAGSFTTMFARLAAARDAQDRLVQDAAHELRTPLPACGPTRASCAASTSCPPRPAPVSLPTSRERPVSSPTWSTSSSSWRSRAGARSPRRTWRHRTRTTTSSVPSASNLTAFSSRLPTARSRAPRRPRTRDPSSSTVMRRPLRRCTRAAARAATSPSRHDDGHRPGPRDRPRRRRPGVRPLLPRRLGARAAGLRPRARDRARRGRGPRRRRLHHHPARRRHDRRLLVAADRLLPPAGPAPEAGPDAARGHVAP